MKLIVLASDHGGYELKEQVKTWLIKAGHQIEDVGAFDDTPSDHPVFAKAGARKVLERDSVGIFICGAGLGMCMMANRIKGIRGITAHNQEFAKLGREHNNANVLCLGGRFLSFDESKEIISTFLQTQFLGGRFVSRVAMLETE
ncbi:MAG: RpiB/LacA/LacB family sugar-phosphate isomerase [Firmicutes bacterium]|nr:RpiB/LacA/LacB family sugar-phosphate isomerase [Bacillota bacterium]